MKLIILALMFCAVVAAAPKTVEPVELSPVAVAEEADTRNILVNTLIRQFIAYLRRIINNGSPLFGIPPLDPLSLDHFHLALPVGLINLELELKDIYMTGMGGFVVHRSNLNLRDLTFELDISVPRLEISTQYYDMVGDLFTAIPLYGRGDASFIVQDFRFQAKLFLGQSKDEQSVILKKIDNVAFQIPTIESGITGAIGGGNIDKIVNAMVEEVIFDYVNRFQGAISLAAAQIVPPALNPILETLDTWKYIAPLLPRP